MLVVETERLIVRNFETSDLDALASLFGSPDVMRFSDGVKSIQWVQDWLSQCIENADPDIGAAPWAVDEKNGSDTIGYCGLFYFPDVCGQAEIEIGYRFENVMSGNSIWNHVVDSLLFIHLNQS